LPAKAGERGGVGPANGEVSAINQLFKLGVGAVVSSAGGSGGVRVELGERRNGVRQRDGAAAGAQLAGDVDERRDQRPSKTAGRFRISRFAIEFNSRKITPWPVNSFTKSKR
jgi:hypothetical protein